MWFVLFLLFIVLSPGTLFTAPSLGKNMGGKVVIAGIHAVVFVIIVKMLYVYEGFAGVISGITIPDYRLGEANTAVYTVGSAISRLQTALRQLRTALASDTRILGATNQNITDNTNTVDLRRTQLNAAQDQLTLAINAGSGWEARKNEYTGRINNGSTQIAATSAQLVNENKRGSRAMAWQIAARKARSDETIAANAARSGRDAGGGLAQIALESAEKALAQAAEYQRLSSL